MVDEADWKTEYEVIQALKSKGHKVKVLGVRSDLNVIRTETFQFQPKIVFNLLEEFAGEALMDQNVVSYLELIKTKYTGSNPRGLILARDKGLSKKILTYHRIPTPRFWVFKLNNKIKVSKKIQYPLFVKTLNEEASLGITQDSIVRNEDQLRERIDYFFKNYQTDVIAETYIEGREFYVAMMGHSRLTTFPIWELFFDKTSDRVPKIATSKVKWDFNYRKKYKIHTGPAKDLEEQTQQKIYQICKKAYRALEISGYARVDLRMDDQGQVYIIEVNPNPDIGDNEDFAAAAAKSGLSYPELLQKIIHLGLKN